MARSGLLKALCACGVILTGPAALLGAAEKRAETPVKPNLVFVLIDDMGKGPVGCYGAEDSEKSRSGDSQTPELDRLAATGMRFTNFYSMPQCVPTRVAVLTGQYPFRNGWVNHYDVPRWNLKGFNPKTNPSIGNIIKSAGYATCIAGKWQISDFREEPKTLNNCGFDAFCVWTGYEAGNPPSDMRYWDAYLHTAERSTTYAGKFGPEICNTFVVDFIHRHESQPMFIYYPMILKHGGAGWRAYEGCSMVECIDRFIGRLVRVLDETGVRDNTILVVTTDNGPQKGKTSEEGVCEPFIVNCPGIVPQGVVTDALADVTDILPTFAELAGAKLPDGYTFDGRSLAPLITGKADDGPRKWILAMGGGPCLRGDVEPSKRPRKARGKGRDRKPPASGEASPPSVEGRNRVPFRDRVLRDQRFKLYVGTDRRAQKMVRIGADGREDGAVRPEDDPEARAAYGKFMKVVGEFPEKDANPRY